MANVYAMYKHPADAAAFDRYYYGVHVPLAKKIPGLEAYQVTRGTIASVGGGSSPYHLIAADLGNFATGGVDLYIAETDML